MSGSKRRGRIAWLAPRDRASPSRPDIDRTAVGRGALWSLATVGAGQGVALLTFLVTARYVSKESFGIMAVSLAAVELLKRIGIEPFALAVATRPAVRDEDYDACFVLTLAATSTMVAVALGAAWAAGTLAGSPQTAEALRIMAALLLTMGLWFTHEAWLLRHMRFRTLAIRAILASALGGAVGVTMAIRGFDLWSLVGQQVITGGTSLLLLWTTTPWRPRLRTTRAALAANLSATRHLCLSAVGTFFSTETDIFVASGILGIQAAGLYNAGKRIMLALHLVLTNSIQTVALSAFANLPETERRRAASLRAIGIVASITIPAAFGVMALSRDLVQVMLGRDWLAAAPVLSALAIGLATVSMTQFNVTIFMVNGRLPAVARYAALTALLNLVLLPAAALFGSTALALGASAVQLIVYPLSTRSALAAAGLSVRDYADRIAKPLMCSAVMAAVLAVSLRTLPFDGLEALALDVPLGGAVYFAALACVGPATIDELMDLVRAIVRGRNAVPG